jgi:vacuolar-type H+-ATPase catalytic subunit A/Vma1
MKGYITIKTPQPVTVEGLYDLMQRQGTFELPYELHGKGMMQTIRFPLKGNNAMDIGARKNSITLAITKVSMLKDIGLSVLTDQWSSVLDTSKKDNQELLEDTAAEVRRITGGK